MKQVAKTEPTDASPKPRKLSPWVRRALAWGVTIAVIAFLFTRYSPAEIANAVSEGNWVAMIPFFAVASLWSLLFMATADWLLFSRALGPMRWFDALRGKAGVSVVQAVNHTVGQGAYGVWVGRLTGSDVATTVGVIGYIALTDLLALFGIVTVAVWFADADVMPRQAELRYLAPAICAGLVVAALVGHRLFPNFKLFAAWKRISVQTFALMTVLRATAVLGVMVGTWAAARAFGLTVPLSVFLALLPVVYLAAALPINVLGFGAVQLVWVAAFSNWATGPEILAFQFLSQVMAVATFIIRGAPFLPSVLRDIAPEKSETDGSASR